MFEQCCLLKAVVFYLILNNVMAEDVNSRISCIPGHPMGPANCQEKGCVFSPVDDPEVPWCILPPDVGYVVSNQVRREGKTIVTLAKNSNFSLFGGDFFTITLSVIEESNSRLRIKVEPDNIDRFEPPIEMLPTEDPLTETFYSVEIKSDPMFSIQIRRKVSNTIIFDTSLSGLILSEQFIQLPIKLPSKNLYGIGENEQHSFRHDFVSRKIWPLYARDQPPSGEPIYRFNMYGTHPRYTVMEDDGNCHGVVFVNSAAQEFEILPLPGLVYRTIGGLLDIYLFLGPTPENVVEQYTSAVGRFYIPPYWALGYHQCRWGYNNLDNMVAAWNRTVTAGIPVDTQWADIDIMEKNLDFTVDPVNFAGLSEFVSSIQEEGYRFVPILDPGISTGQPQGTYPAFETGQNRSVWILRSDKTAFMGSVWPEDPVNYVDFTNPTSQEWWIEQIEKFYDILPWDGLWIDMNEPSNMVSGDVEQECLDNHLNRPPYSTQAYGHTLADRTVCPDAVQFAGRHYDLHNMYGWYQTRPTLEAVQLATHKRGLVLSRSTFLSSGRWAAHWLGDNFSFWSNMHYSIIGILQFNQFGIPFVGADICGFAGVTNPEMCIRWHQLGAFYPFSRNHNWLMSPDQDPAMLGEEAVTAIRSVLNLRYYILPYFYTLFYHHHQKGSTVARPLWHEFPHDNLTLGIDTQFMLGSSLLLCPVLHEGWTNRSCYIPSGVWYEGQNLVISGPGLSLHMDTGDNLIIDLPLNTTGVFLRGGSIIPIQYPGSNTRQSRDNPMGLVVLLDNINEASGDLYIDDGESIDPVANDQFSVINITFYNNQLIYSPQNLGYHSTVSLENIWVAGFDQEVASVNVNGENWYNWSVTEYNYIIIRNISLSVVEPFVVDFIF